MLRTKKPWTTSDQKKYLKPCEKFPTNVLTLLGGAPAGGGGGGGGGGVGGGGGGGGGTQKVGV